MFRTRRAPSSPPSLSRRRDIGWMLLCACTVLVGLMLYRLPAWIDQNFGEVSLEQVLFHANVDATEGLPTRLVRSTLRELLFKPAGAMLLAFSVLMALWHSRWRRPAIAAVLLAGAVLGVAGTRQTYEQLSLADYFDRDPTGTQDWMQAHYARPAWLVGGAPANIVLIYVESLEQVRVRPDSTLGRLSRQGLSAARFESVVGTSWTMGGIVGSQCSLPLLPVGMVARNAYDEIDAPMPGATCLGDVLRKAGYRTSFLGGASSEFAGKGKFLGRHGYTRVYGLHEIRSEAPDLIAPSGWWGLTDHDLFRFARQHLREEARQSRQQRQPFFVSMLTLDTHGPDGHLSETCATRGHEATVPSIFDCAVDEVGSFLEWMATEGLLDNTVVAVMGDHPLMRHGQRLGGAVSHLQGRDVFFMLLDGRQKPAGRRIDMTHFDVAPTVLSAAGFTLPQGRFGLGADLAQHDSLLAQAGSAQVRRMLRSPSPGYLALWRVPGKAGPMAQASGASTAP